MFTLPTNNPMMKALFNTSLWWPFGEAWQLWCSCLSLSWWEPVWWGWHHLGDYPLQLLWSSGTVQLSHMTILTQLCREFMWSVGSSDWLSQGGIVASVRKLLLGCLVSLSQSSPGLRGVQALLTTSLLGIFWTISVLRSIIMKYQLESSRTNMTLKNRLWLHL